MASSLILSVQEGSIAFGEKIIFEDLTFHIHEGDKVCLVGKNGSGKSTLMNIITGNKDLDSGKRWLLNGITIGYLQQDIIPKKGQSVYDFVFEQIKKDGEEELNKYKVEMIIAPLELDANDMMDRLSGGELRRACLARALVEEPDVLLLDEPTNHLDLDVIEWLENYLNMYRGAILCVSHDKRFLENISNKVFWLNRGNINVCPKGFKHFNEWSTTLIEQEERELKNRQKFVEQEVEWATRGVKARRKRNVRRLEQMKIARAKLKSDKSAFRRMMAKIKVGEMEDTEGTSKIVAEFFNVFKKFKEPKTGKERLILDKFSMRIIRGDRIGLLGKNGSGKTTFLKLLVKELEQDSGKIKLAKNIEFSYFDQKRSALKYDETVRRILCPQGGDYMEVMGKTRHVCGYLKEFLFDPAMVQQQVGTLSGGQKNRLMLAKILANPKSFLILDEPTNDLDMDTLDILEEILSQYKGTLIIVSHDRDFLDQTVTKILAFEGDGVIEGCIGGYSDYLNNKKDKIKKTKKEEAVKAKKAIEKASPKIYKKLTYKLQYELDNLPDEISELEGIILEKEALLNDPDFYSRDALLFDETSKELLKFKENLETQEIRWLEIEEMRKAIEV